MPPEKYLRLPLLFGHNDDRHPKAALCISHKKRLGLGGHFADSQELILFRFASEKGCYFIKGGNFLKNWVVF